MKHKKSHLLLSFCILLALQSCSPVYYVPNQPNMPMFRKGSEGKASFNIASPLVGEVNNAFEGQISASVINHFGITTNGFIASGKNNDSYDDSYKGQGHLWEFGLGYFNLVDNKWGVDVFAGAGKGAVTIFENDISFFKADISKWYIQPSFYFSSKHFEAGLAFRISNINYNNVRPGKTYYDSSNKLTTNRALFYEPSIFCGFGGPLVKGHVQFTPSFLISNEMDFNREKVMLSVGIDFIINRNYESTK